MAGGTRATEEPGRELIVIGASAGGIDALSTLVAALPPDFRNTVIVVQHLDPRRGSHLVEILRRATSLTVETIDRERPLEPAAILVAPPDKDIEVHGDAVTPTEGGHGRPSPSIDRLLSTAAREHPDAVTAVILTGTGSDGAQGAREVKAAGGTVIVQNPRTAAYPEMPQAVPPPVVDIVADLEAIGPLLADLALGTFGRGRPDDERLLRTFLDQVRERSGIDFASYKRATILRRLQRRMAATGMPRLREYIHYVQDHPDEYERLTSSFLIKVTEFFRDPDLFTHLRSEIVPALVEEAANRGNELRVWSAGCATGEEAYSLAILVAEALGARLDDFTVRIFATDVDLDAIAFARRGIYPASSLTDLPPELLERHFDPVGGGQYEVKKRIRALTVFGQHDLGQRAPFPRVDLILCRNVLIYFTPELQKRALQLFAFSLREGGRLVLGKAESTSPLPEYFVLEQPRLKVYRRHGERVLIPPARIRDTAPLLPARTLGRRGWDIQVASVRDVTRTPASAEKAETVLLRLPVGVVVVDARYDIQSINAAARRLLGIHGPAVGDDLVHLAPESVSGALRTSIDAALHGETPTSEHALPALDDDREERHVEIAAAPLTSERPPVEAVLVTVQDVTAVVRARLAMHASLAEARAVNERRDEHAARLEERNRVLLEANQALTTANAELRSANEELLVANEEVQAATEEVETLNEELQATNEELETLNEELQATVEELNTTNDDLQARSVELIESAAEMATQREQAERDRRRFQAVLEWLDEAVVVVDGEGRAVMANRRFRDLLGSEDPEVLQIGAKHARRGSALWGGAASGAEVSVRFRPVADPDGPALEARGRGIDDGGEPLGVVVVRQAGA